VFSISSKIVYFVHVNFSIWCGQLLHPWMGHEGPLIHFNDFDNFLQHVQPLNARRVK
jgi:hypothetical protein